MGESFSGRERNCTYLNLGRDAQRFANVSAVSGFDFPDDARAVALVDWDHDGNLDTWLTNRSAPRIRLLRNASDTENHFVVVKLEGRSCNRDAIGATVEVILEPSGVDEGSAPKSVKSLRAGQGFLSQSSKWIHFGLGPAAKIDKLVVRWPGGDSEEFSGANVDSWYRLIQGTGVAESWTPPARSLQLPPRQQEVPESSSQTRSVLAHRPPLPRLDYTTRDGHSALLGEPRQKPILVNLWASSCSACLAELKEFAAKQQPIREAGLDVLALSVDGLGEETTDEEEFDPQTAFDLLDRRSYPFAAGMANTELVDKLQLTMDQLYVRDLPPAVPLTLLLDEQGRIAAIYRGKVGVDRVLDDVKQMTRIGSKNGSLAMRDAAVPRPGTWVLTKYREDSHMSQIASALASRGYKDDSIDYLERNLTTAKNDPRYVQTLVSVGQALFAKQEFARAEAKFREALQTDPRDIEGIAGLGRALAAQGKHSEAIPLYRALVKERPDDVGGLVSLGVLFQSIDQHEKAIPFFKQALDIDPKHSGANLFLGKFFRHSNQTDEAIEHLQMALRSQPESNDIRFELGMARLQKGENREARNLLRQVVIADHEGSYLNQMNNQAWFLATRQSPLSEAKKMAIVMAELIVEASGQPDPSMLDTLAVAYAADGRFMEAVATEEQAIKIALARGDLQQLVAELRQRLKQFRQRKPYREKPAGY